MRAFVVVVGRSIIRVSESMSVSVTKKNIVLIWFAVIAFCVLCANELHVPFQSISFEINEVVFIMVSSI